MIRLRLHVNIDTVVRVLTGIVAFLITMGIAVALIRTYTPYKTAMGVIQLFHMDRERTLTSHFSSLDLGFSSLLLGFIARIKKQLFDKYWMHWAALAVGFMFLSLDENIGIHELITRLLQDNQVGSMLPPHYFTTMIGISVVVPVFLAYRSFLKSLPRKVGLQFIISGVVFAVGAFGFELIGGYIDSHPQVWPRGFYRSIVILEESMELIGIVLFVKALLLYIKSLAHVSPLLGLLDEASVHADVVTDMELSSKA